MLHPLNIPDNIENRYHATGEFAVQFLGSHDYAHISHGRVFGYCDGDDIDGKRGITARNATSKSFVKGI